MLVIAVHELDPVLKVVFHLREMVLKDLIRIATNSSILAGDPVSEIYAEERGLDPTVDQNIWCAVFLCLNHADLRSQFLDVFRGYLNGLRTYSAVSI